MKALIVEDELVSRRLLKRLLTRFFLHNVLEAADGEEGLTMVEQERPAIVFFDLYMPRRDGLGSLQRFRAKPEFAQLPAVAISGARDRDLALQLVELGILDYILKPIDIQLTIKRLDKPFPELVAHRSLPKP